MESSGDQAHPYGSALLVACEMLEDEVLCAHAAATRAHSALDLPTVWVESGLHEHPDKLRAHLQELLDRIDEAHERQQTAVLPSVVPGRGPASERAEYREVSAPECVLLAFGFCGNGLQGLVSRSARLVFPRVDDCISLFLNHGCAREEIRRDSRAFYLTRGWLAHDNPMQQDYEAWKKRFGREQALDLRRRTMGSYERISLLDTGAYDPEECLDLSRELAEELDLDHAVVPASYSLLQRLLTGPWDSEIVQVPPGREIDIWHLFEPERGCR